MRISNQNYIKNDKGILNKNLCFFISSVVDFNNVIYQTGVELSTCKVDKVPAKDDDKDQEIFTPKPINPYDETTDPRVNIVEPDPSIEWEVSTLQPPTSSTRYSR